MLATNLRGSIGRFGVVAAASLSAATVVCCSDPAAKKTTEISSLPTVQATTRSFRLFGTCLLMVADYKLESFYQRIGAGPRNSPDDVSSSHDDEYYVRLAEFERAQKQYTKNSHPELNIEDRVIAKQDEKKIMTQAAERLAEVEARATNKTRSATHQRAAQRLLDLCHQNRGVYIKIGQHLANLDYLLPIEYIDTLSQLFDDNPITDFDDVCAVIEEDLGKHPDQLFQSFDPNPIASASLAQVHVAFDESGKKLAVKVQHRGLKETATGDVQNLVFAVEQAERFLENFSFGWLAEEIAPNVPKELDFRNEGQNSERAAEHLINNTKLDCVVPAIHWNRTSSRVLTMDFEEGVKAGDTEGIQKAGLNPFDLSKLVASVFATQIFDAGFVHCDPHEGNMLFRKSKKTGKPQMVLIDHGLYRELEPDFRKHYASLWKSLLIADVNGIYQACMKLGVNDIRSDGDTYRLFAGVLTARPFDEVVERSKQRNSLIHSPGKQRSASDHVMIRGYAQKYLGEIIALLDHIPRAMLMLLKTNDCLRHIDHLLGTPPLRTMLVTGEYANYAVYQSSHCTNFIEKFHCWLGYAFVMARVQIQKLALFLLY